MIVALVVLGAVVYAATGRGGELSAEHPDYAPLELGPVSATDVVLLRPPTALWGYNVQVTDEALERIAEAIRARDVRIVALEQLVTDLSHDPAPAPASSLFQVARHRRAGVFPGPDDPNEHGEQGEQGGTVESSSGTMGRSGIPPEQSHG